MKIDFTYLETISDGDHEFIQEFLSTFEETYIALTKKLIDEFASNDFANLGKTAHQLKPSAKMLGLECAEDLENFQNNPETATIEKLNFIKDNCHEGFSELKIWAKEKGAE
ncbi:MAG: Hpt domain-containing protein [Cyclobacteriaceae bacterium]